MRRRYNIAELFSGIGSQAKALHNLGVDINTVATCEWDVHAIVAYDMIHTAGDLPESVIAMSKKEILSKLKSHTFSNSGKEPLDFAALRTYSADTLRHIYASISRNHNYVDITSLSGKDLSGDIDILTYSFPCQDLSNVGAFHGYNKGIDKNSGSRSSLLWQVGRILTEMKRNSISLPRYLLMENVPALLAKRHFQNFATWIRDLQNLGYISKFFHLNASSFGLPQNRPRLLMISIFVGDDKEAGEVVSSYMECINETSIISDFQNSDFFHQYHISDFLRTNYSNQKIYDEALESTPNNTVSRQKIWDENPKIILENNTINDQVNVIRTITTKQDRNPNSGNLYFENHIEGKCQFRYLTPRECMLFMGFTDDDFRKLKNNNLEFHKNDYLFSRDKVIRMAGNSIPVKLLEGIFLQILKIDEILETLMDVHDKQTRSFNMSRIRSKDTKPEEIVRKYLFSLGFRYRKNDKRLSGSPDIVLPKYKTAIFINGCFWHGHEGCPYFVWPKSNADFWRDKITANIERDKKTYSDLQNRGWKIIVLWECALRLDRRENTFTTLVNTLHQQESQVDFEPGLIQIG